VISSFGCCPHFPQLLTVSVLFCYLGFFFYNNCFLFSITISWFYDSCLIKDDYQFMAITVNNILMWPFL
jgi:hypothetical protein